MIISFCIGVMCLITIFSVIGGTAWSSYTAEYSGEQTIFVNGTATELVVGNQNLLFEIDGLIGGLIMLVVLATVIAIIGLQVLASGLSETSIKTLRTSIAYGGLWGVLSIASYPLITSIATFGVIIYVGLTLLFIIGVFQKLGDTG